MRAHILCYELQTEGDAPKCSAINDASTSAASAAEFLCTSNAEHDEGAEVVTSNLTGHVQIAPSGRGEQENIDAHGQDSGVH